MKITAEQKKRTYELILKHAYEAFLQTDYEKIKLSDISKACHIGEGTLYNYFKDKPTLFIATFIRYRGENQEVFKVYRPNDFETLITEILEILSFYMKIEHPSLERAFLRFLHLLNEQNLSTDRQMSQALETANQYIYDAVLQTLRLSPLVLIEPEPLFEVIAKQVEGVFSDYHYGKVDFDGFIQLVKSHITIILRPYTNFEH